MHRENGFTLVEIVTVVIMLAILMIIAAPKLINLQTDANKAKLINMQNAINTANIMVYGKAVSQGKSDTNEDIIILATDSMVDSAFGYIQATKIALESVLNVKFDDAQTIDGNNEWIIQENAFGVGFVPSVEIWLRNVSADITLNETTTACSLIYTPATVLTRTPSVTIQTDAC